MRTMHLRPQARETQTVQSNRMMTNMRTRKLQLKRVKMRKMMRME
jgi:hypothetical protein